MKTANPATARVHTGHVSKTSNDRPKVSSKKYKQTAARVSTPNPRNSANSLASSNATLLCIRVRRKWFEQSIAESLMDPLPMIMGHVCFDRTSKVALT